ncbi:MAG: hypothetical protein CSB34_02380 [Desulfobulbus propionicus]|nr:MAG: hypothetical protein CSB34_02380 [Desulfobulbus propionicus]
MKKKKSILLLGVLAAAQLVLVGVNWKDNRPLVSKVERSELLSFERQHIDGLTIFGDGQKLSLSKTENGWQTAAGFPADKHKIDGLLLRLKDLQFGMPVATSAEALKRFKVAEDTYNRRLQLKAADTIIADFYLGTGAGARHSHARRADQDAVYAVALGNYDVPVAVDEWQDKTLLQFREDEVTGLTSGDVQVKRVVIPAEGEEKEMVRWKSVNPQAANLMEEQVQSCVSALAGISIGKVLGKTPPEIDEKGAQLGLELSMKESARTYQFNKLQDGKEFLLKVADFDEYFQLESYVVDPILKQCVGAQWIVTEETPEVGSEEQPQTPAQVSEQPAVD